MKLEDAQAMYNSITITEKQRMNLGVEMSYFCGLLKHLSKQGLKTMKNGHLLIMAAKIIEVVIEEDNMIKVMDKSNHKGTIKKIT